jgi:hypothetical protein
MQAKIAIKVENENVRLLYKALTQKLNNDLTISFRLYI